MVIFQKKNLEIFIVLIGGVKQIKQFKILLL